MLVPGTQLYRKQQKGEFELFGPFEILDEMRILIENLELQGTEFRSNHASNYLRLKAGCPKTNKKCAESDQ